MERFFKCRRTIADKRASPFGAHLDELAEYLAEAGYSRLNGRQQLQLAAEFGQWLQQWKRPVTEFGLGRLNEFLRDRAKTRRPFQRGTTFFRLLNDLLRRKGLIGVERSVPQTPVNKVVAGFDRYLCEERCLFAGTVVRYVAFVEDWLTDRFGDRSVAFSSLTAADVLTYVQRRAPTMGRKTAKLMVSALRSFLQYARYRGYIRQDLAIGIPPFANWSRTSIPRGIPQQDIRRVLAHCNRRLAVGRRDYAILLLLARLGLRAGEVVSLALEDINWEEGRLDVRGKGTATQLPLPPDVGEAIAAYLKRGRPHSKSRQVFLRSRAPAIAFKDQRSVGAVVAHALKRARIDSPRKGSHQFRHALATDMLRRGASLGEIGELLRHRNVQTTTIYAKVDLGALRSLVQSWPGAAA